MGNVEHLTREQIIDGMARAKATRERDWVLFLVTFWHGLRANEALALTPANFADGFVTVQRLKGSLKTVQPLVYDGEELLDEKAAIERWLSLHKIQHGGDGLRRRLFPISAVHFWRLMQRYGREAGLPRKLCHPHVFKHSIAMQSIGAGIQNVKKYLGHKSISSTGAYLEVGDEEASRAV